MLIYIIIKKPKDLILNKAKDYYKNNKKRLREHARDKYRSLSEKEKKKKKKYRKNSYCNMSEENFQKAKEKYSKEKAAEYYLINKEAKKETSR